jgi:palmitoyltransferase
VEIEKITPKIKDRIFRIVPDGAEKQLKWCELCEWVIDARSAHCTSCKRCTIRVSHHCWFINNCVGEKNYASFIGLLISSAALLVIQLICVVQTAIFVHGDYSGFLKRSHWFANYYSSRLVVNSVLGLLVILGIGSLGFVLQFLVFQAFLKMKGMTMIEYAAKNKRLNLI